MNIYITHFLYYNSKFKKESLMTFYNKNFSTKCTSIIQIRARERERENGHKCIHVCVRERDFLSEQACSFKV